MLTRWRSMRDLHPGLEIICSRLHRALVNYCASAISLRTVVLLHRGPLSRELIVGHIFYISRTFLFRALRRCIALVKNGLHVNCSLAACCGMIQNKKDYLYAIRWCKQPVS
ncbi:F2U3 [Hyposoter didymator ichnovirus]|nr:F2U3 [Hyposoter didymator ichnovirus]AIK25736.1 F2U3 [Hyposoter didymator ichnovirus]